MNSKEKYLSIFEVDNARNEKPEVLAPHFVWTSHFDRLLNSKNHIVLGARGSGKTAILKMLSHEYLSESADSKAQEIVTAKKFIGTYLATSVDWVGALNNKDWISADRLEEIFRWRLNVASAQSFLRTAESCLNCYVTELSERVELEQVLAREYGKSLLGHEKASSLHELGSLIEDYEYDLTARLMSNTADINDELFQRELFAPLRRLISLLKRSIAFPSSTTWFVCLDEAEFLNEAQHRIINTILRSDQTDIFFKVSTLPYKHHTLDTNLGVKIANKHDFEYIYIDNTFATSSSATNKSVAVEFVNAIFSKRIDSAESGFKGSNLKHFLGSSQLLGESDFDDAEGNDELGWNSPNSLLWSWLKKYSSKRTVDRAENLRNTKDFDDQIGRKLKGALILVHAVASLKGNKKLDIYSGYDLLVVCTDGNPRVAISLINQMLLKAPGSIKSSGLLPVPPSVQNEVFDTYGSVLLNRIKGARSNSISLEEIIDLVGAEFFYRLHQIELGTDTYGTIKLKDSISTLNNESIWSVVKDAVDEGLLYPIMNKSNPDMVPQRGGSYRLAYALAPKFRLMPRKGLELPLDGILSNKALVMSRLSRKSQESLEQLGLDL